jgi:hypothetical protein
MADEIRKGRIDEFFAYRSEIHESMLNMSTEYFKYMSVLNGGAAAGIVASIDKLVAVVCRSSLKDALICFSVGLILNAVALFFTYFNQARIREASHIVLAELERKGVITWNRKRSPFFYGAFSCCVGSLLSFCCGIAICARGIQ